VRWARHAAAGLLLGLLAGCVTAPSAPPCRLSGASAVSVELLFGLSIPGGGTVSPDQFDAFLATEVAPRFPGFTVLPAAGYWQGRPEGARVVMVAAPDDADTARKLDAVRAAYRTRFSQRSVGLITAQSCAAF
jgi:hypothetical protein